MHYFISNLAKGGSMTLAAPMTFRIYFKMKAFEMLSTQGNPQATTSS